MNLCVYTSVEASVLFFVFYLSSQKTLTTRVISPWLSSPSTGSYPLTQESGSAVWTQCLGWWKSLSTFLLKVSSIFQGKHSGSSMAPHVPSTLYIWKHYTTKQPSRAPSPSQTWNTSMIKNLLPVSGSCSLLPPNLQCQVISAQHPLHLPFLIDVKFLKTGTRFFPSLCSHICGTKQTHGKVL